MFNVLLGVQAFHVLKTVQKCKKFLKNSKILKNYVHFQIPHPNKLVLSNNLFMPHTN